MEKFEIGVTEIFYPHLPRWTGVIVGAENENEAEDKAGDLGYYRNVVVRKVIS